jgi:hypothetical protein
MLFERVFARGSVLSDGFCEEHREHAIQIWRARPDWRACTRRPVDPQLAPQNKKYFCANGKLVAGSQVSSTPSARTS